MTRCVLRASLPRASSSVKGSSSEPLEQRLVFETLQIRGDARPGYGGKLCGYRAATLRRNRFAPFQKALDERALLAREIGRRRVDRLVRLGGELRLPFESGLLASGANVEVVDGHNQREERRDDGADACVDRHVRNRPSRELQQSQRIDDRKREARDRADRNRAE